MDGYKKNKKGYLENFLTWLLKKRISVPTQQYYNGPCMDGKVHDITLKIVQRGKLWQKPVKNKLRGILISKKKHDVIFSLVSKNIS